MSNVRYPMIKLVSVSRSFRRCRVAVLAALVIGGATFGLAASPGAEVVAIQPTRVADLVLLRGGFDAGLRQGMVCRISRGPAEIAEVLLVEIRPSCGAALIVSVAARQSIRAGDRAQIKVLKS